MDIVKLSLTEVRDKIAAKELSSVEVAKAVFSRIKETADLNTLITVTEESALEKAAEVDGKIARGEKIGALAGVPIIVKDNISTKGIRTTCASEFLSNYVPPFDATVVKKLKAADAVIVGKANMDEFAMGSANENSAFGPVKNAVNPARVPGGSSGGSASSVAAFQAYGALGSDTGGSIRQPASFCGVVGLKPTYSAVSRFGLVAFASSLDQIGPLTRCVRDNAELLNVIAGHDETDSTSSSVKTDYTDYVSGVKGKTVGIPKEFFAQDFSSEVKNAVLAAAKIYEKAGASLKEISIGSFDAALATYYVIACAEATSNLARFDGVKYGLRADADDYIDLYYKSRTAYFGAEVKRRIMIGNYVLSSGYYDAYYLKASKIRTKIKAEFDAALKECDFILSPTAPTTAFEAGRKTSDPTEAYLADIFTVPVNIIGNPAISIPCGADKDGMPIGAQLIGRSFGEKELYGAAETLEKELG